MSGRQFDPAAIPLGMRERRQWLIYRVESKPGQKKPAKMPYYATGVRRQGEQGAASDREALVSFDEACAAVELRRLGRSFRPESASAHRPASSRGFLPMTRDWNRCLKAPSKRCLDL